MEAIHRLRDYLEPLAEAGICIAFSGGVDSALLLAAAVEVCGRGKVHAVTLHTPLHPPSDSKEAKELAEELGAIYSVVEIPEIPEAIRNNPSDRCYLCKKDLFSRLWDDAATKQLSHLLDGTNADDLKEYRPGLQALRELRVASPLAELGITKKQVREMAEAMGLSVSKKPSTPCLATRFPYGDPLTPDGMERANQMERFLRDKGFPVVRARVHRDVLRLEVPVTDLERLLSHREELVSLGRELGFYYVSLDLAGFSSGSMDIPLGRG